MANVAGCWQEDTMIENLYDLIGGQETIKAVTERFYERVLKDDSLRHFFGQTDMVHLRSRQVMLISMLLGGGIYTGKDLPSAHADARDHGLGDAHFDVFLKHFRAALEEAGVEPENAEKVMKPLENKRRAILDR
jgi:hemoglobin